MASWFGVLKAGAVAVTTMPLLRAGELATIAEIAKVDFALCDSRLTDELQRRSRFLPAEDEPLSLRLGQSLPADRLSCGLANLAATLGQTPGLSLVELAERAPICRLKVRLAAALLAEAGCL